MRSPTLVTFGCFFAGLDAPGRAGLELKSLNFDVLDWKNCFAIDNCGKVCSYLRETSDHGQVIHKLVADVDPATLPPVHIAWLSPPCDLFSQNAKSTGCRRMFDFIPYLELRKPPIVMMEQVKGLTFKNHSKLIKEWTRTLRGLGYKVKSGLHDALNYGVPQSRVRFILIAIIKPRQQLVWPAHHPWNAAKKLPLRPFNQQTDIPFALPPRSFKSQKREGNLMKRTISQSKESGLSVRSLIIDICCSPSFATKAHNLWPCLTRTRCTSRSYWVL